MAWVSIATSALETELYAGKIREGISLNHLEPGHAIPVYNIIRPPKDKTVSMAMNVPSNKYGKKDIVKVENVSVADYGPKLFVVAAANPHATFNVIRDWKVVDKWKPGIPPYVYNVECDNKECISNNPREPVTPRMVPRKIDDKMALVCDYCETYHYGLTNLRIRGS